MKFLINEKEGVAYSKRSGDKNKIHINNLTGYNSLFGQKIVHGTLILEKILTSKKIKKKLINLNQYFIEINFLKHMQYNKKVNVNFKTDNIFQNNNKVAEINIKNQNFITDLSSNRKSYTVVVRKEIKNNYFQNLLYLLKVLSKYVGMIYPGENSIIQNIKINYNNKFKYDQKKIFISSKKISKKFPIILNKLIYSKFHIFFTTYERPVLKINKAPIKKNLIKHIINIKEPILIIGSSSGIGNEMLNIFQYNKKVPIFGTYNKNKFNKKNLNIKIFKLDLDKNIISLKKYFKKFSKLRIYYFATPKIYLKAKDKESITRYKNFYINYPKKILKLFSDKKINFFYPSTIYINRTNSYYAKIKNKAEKILTKLKNKNRNINLLRVDEVNTRQNLSLIKTKFPNFSDLLSKNSIYREKIFFLNSTNNLN